MSTKEMKLKTSQINEEEVTNLYAFMLSANQADLPECYVIGNTEYDGTCINKSGERWEVYEVVRGKVYQKAFHNSCKDACYDLILRLADCSHVLGKAVTTFERLISKKFSEEELEEFIVKRLKI